MGCTTWQTNAALTKQTIGHVITRKNTTINEKLWSSSSTEHRTIHGKPNGLMEQRSVYI